MVEEMGPLRDEGQEVVRVEPALYQLRPYRERKRDKS